MCRSPSFREPECVATLGQAAMSLVPLATFTGSQAAVLAGVGAYSAVTLGGIELAKEATSVAMVKMQVDSIVSDFQAVQDDFAAEDPDYGQTAWDTFKLGLDTAALGTMFG